MRRKKIIKTARNSRVPCISRIRTLKMFYDGRVIGTVSEESNDAGEFDWVIKINWENWEKNPVQVAGIDMGLRLDEYIRAYLPMFVEERTLPDNRDCLMKELARVGMTTNDRFEYMCKTRGSCGCNNITVEFLEEKYLDPTTGNEIVPDKNWTDTDTSKYKPLDFVNGRWVI